MKLNEIQKFSKQIVKLCISSFIIFTIIILIFNWLGKQVQPQLIIAFSGFIGIELVTLMWGTVTKEKQKVKERSTEIDIDIPSNNDYNGRGV